MDLRKHVFFFWVFVALVVFIPCSEGIAREAESTVVTDIPMARMLEGTPLSDEEREVAPADIENITDQIDVSDEKLLLMSKVVFSTVVRKQLDLMFSNEIDTMLHKHFPQDADRTLTFADLSNDVKRKAIKSAYDRIFSKLYGMADTAIDKVIAGHSPFSRTKLDVDKYAIDPKFIEDHKFLFFENRIEFPVVGDRLDKKWLDYFKIAALFAADFGLEVIEEVSATVVLKGLAKTLPQHFDKLGIDDTPELGANPDAVPHINTFVKFMADQTVRATVRFGVQKLNFFKHKRRTGLFTKKDGHYYHVVFRDKDEWDQILEDAVVTYQVFPDSLLDQFKGQFRVGEQVVPRRNWKNTLKLKAEKYAGSVANFVVHAVAGYGLYAMWRKGGILYNRLGNPNRVFSPSSFAALGTAIALATALDTTMLGAKLLYKYVSHRLQENNKQMPIGITYLGGTYHYVYKST